MMARRRRSNEDVALGCLVYMLLIIFLMPVAGICFLCIVRLRLKYPEGRFLLAANSICLPIGYQTIACSQMRRFPTNRA